LNLAKTAVKNGKKALAIEKAKTKDGQFPSGWNDDTMDAFILDTMWIRLQGKKEDDESDDDEDARGSEMDYDAAIEANPRPKDWTFMGWMAYRLFGPRGDYTSVLFTTEEKKGEKGSNGRADCRKEVIAASGEGKEKMNIQGKDKMSLQKDLVFIAQVESRTAIKMHQVNLAAIEIAIQTNNHTIKTYSEMMSSLDEETNGAGTRSRAYLEKTSP